MIDKDTSIRVKQSTKDRLKDLGKKGDSYNDIVVRLIDFFKGQ